MEGQCKQDQKPPRDFYLRKSVLSFLLFGDFSFEFVVVSVPFFFFYGLF